MQKVRHYGAMMPDSPFARNSIIWMGFSETTGANAHGDVDEPPIIEMSNDDYACERRCACGRIIARQIFYVASILAEKISFLAKHK